jgi:hypothetical protein
MSDNQKANEIDTAHGYLSYEQVFHKVQEKIKNDLPSTARFPEIAERLAIEMASAEWKAQCSYSHGSLKSGTPGLLQISWWAEKEIAESIHEADDRRVIVETTISHKEARELAHQILNAIGDPVPIYTDHNDTYGAGGQGGGFRFAGPEPGLGGQGSAAAAAVAGPLRSSHGHVGGGGEYAPESNLPVTPPPDRILKGRIEGRGVTWY